jgi:hypothetical protein
MISKKNFVIISIMAVGLFGLLFWVMKKPDSETSTIAVVETDQGAVDQATFDLIRFDRDFAELGKGDFKQKFTVFQNKYGEWVSIYLFQILGLDPQLSSSDLEVYVQGILKERNIAQLDQTVALQYANNDSLKNAMKPLVGYWNKYFPKMPIKRIVAINSMFGLRNGLIKGGILDDSTLFVSLECFLGDHFDYEKLGEKIYAYQRFATRPEYMVPTLADAALNNILGFGLEGRPLLEQMIFHGKWYFVKKRLLPDFHDSLIMEYPGEKLKWALKNEGNIWGLLTSRNYLYSIENQVIARFINDGPFTMEMPKESPGKIGRWVGWRIVEQFMNTNDSYNMDDLLKNQDAQKILKLSGYKPKSQ